MEWKHQFTKTRPITLLETIRKAVVKIITQKLSQIITNNNILKGKNHVALPDLSKAYDRVDIKILELVLNKIKIPKRIVQLFVNLFSNSRKAVITTTRITQFYKALIGIDQSEVISPLVWTIYYDPLLSYMDDVSWIIDTSYKLESILQIADEFNRLNNIQINPDKFALMTNNTKALKDKSIKLNFGSHVQEIQLIRLTESVRILGAWINLNLSKYTILNDKQVAALNILMRTLFKKKTNLVMTIPNWLLGTLSKLSIIHLQQEILSVNNVLTEWKIHLKDLKIKYNLIASTLAIMYDNNLTCQSNIERKIMGGQLPIIQVLNSDLLFKDRLNYHLQRHNIYFLNQIMAADGIRLLTYSDLQYHLQGSKVSENILRKKQWIVFYSDKLDSSYFGRILSNDQTPIDIQLRSKRKTANNRCLLFIDKEKTINVKAQSIQNTYILDSSVFEYIAMIENRIKYSITNSQEASVRSMLDFFHSILLRNQLINIQDTVKGQSSLTIYTDGSFKRHSNTSIMMVKAHDSDDHSNVVNKLAKEACSKECLVIDPKLLAHNSTICWNHKPIERNITLMVKDIREIQYIEQFLMLNRNKYFISPSDLESFDWSLTFRYIKDKFDETSAFDSSFNSFKTKLHAEELPTQDNLCKRSPSVYIGSWRCVLCNTELETYQHLWSCFTTQNMKVEIVHNSKDQLFNLILPFIQDKINIDYNDISTNIDNLDC
ncbi:hypothetical protein GLOIN_2v1766738 [Rhizophagus clarus]|uniref:Reverse transcriptase domain-containing protein n=1 Tax=Rhizophagus clarus TaxID=94130 RepID=A0A8H3KTD9_9GLOM|nr:hypothetical protein GLOIN_2v1766738 [Rhizophagus clarus]